MSLPGDVIDAAVGAALAEDLGGRGDITSSATLPADLGARFRLAARVAGVFAGRAVASAVARRVDPRIVLDWSVADGDAFAAGAVLARIEGPARSILTAERTLLNFVGRLCGVATLTRAYVDAVAGTGATIAHTRKTTPGLRALEIAAVAAGGGSAHRFGLDDAVLIKDNHVELCGGVAAAVARARAAVGHMTRVAVEIDTPRQLDEALDAGAESILLDNFTPAELAVAVARARARGVTLEASGGVDLESVRSVAETGVDVISVGALTHSAPSLDVGLDTADG